MSHPNMDPQYKPQESASEETDSTSALKPGIFIRGALRMAGTTHPLHGLTESSTDTQGKYGIRGWVVGVG